MNNKITIILADDHPIVRNGLRKEIEEDRRLEVIAEANNGQEAIEAIKANTPNVTVLDVDMPVMNGFDVARWIRKEGIATEVVFLTMHKDENLFNEAIDLGAKGFVLKDSALKDIVECIKTVAASENYVSNALTTFLMNRSKRAIGLIEKEPTINDLTKAERRILSLIADDLTTNEIAEKLFISPRTVEKHRSNISQKLDLHGTHSLVKFAYNNKSELL
ncbi:MAG: response regulator transcription factor [Pyrinomonadaceae bacterium]|nr:response regulator transcription factor [Pyrinomonadaceae bacterium]